MKKLGWIALITALLVPAEAFAMPPHPNVITQWKENGTFDSNIARYNQLERKYAEKRSEAESASGSASKKSSGTAVKKSSTVSGSWSIPVILIQFPGKSESSALPLSPIAAAILFLAIFGGSASVALRSRRRGLSRAALAIAAVPGIFFFSPGCGKSDPESSFTGNSRFDSKSTTAYYSDLFEGSGLTMKKYYEDMSNGKFHPTFDIYGPYTADHSHDYYGTNDKSGNDAHAITLADEAIEKLVADKDSTVDFSKYDNDGNGTVDGVMIIHQGPGEEVSSDDEGNNIWSFMSATSVPTDDNVSFRNYSMQPEYILEPGDSTVGVFCHEFGHILGLPDLYDTVGSTEGAGDWSLMSGGSWNGPSGMGAVPAPLLAWERHELGWLEYKDAQNGSNTVTDINTSFSAIKVPLHTESFGSYGQYLLVENIVKTAGSWTQYLPGSGLLVTKIDEWWIHNTENANLVNGASYKGSYITVHGVTVIQNGIETLWSTPDATSVTNGGRATDTFCSENGSISLGPVVALTANSPYSSLIRNTNYSAYATSSVIPISGCGYTASSGVTLSNFSVRGNDMTFEYSYTSP